MDVCKQGRGEKERNRETEERQRETCLFGFLTSSSTTRLYRRRTERDRERG